MCSLLPSPQMATMSFGGETLRRFHDLNLARDEFRRLEQLGACRRTLKRAYIRVCRALQEWELAEDAQESK